MFAILTVLAVPQLEAAKHPALGASIDPAKCIQCHADVTKGKFVHAAMGKGCLSCHEFRASNDITRVKLVTTSPLALCLGCHADKNAANLKGKVHSPAVRQCLPCHNPHSGEDKNLLVKPAQGAGMLQNLCLSCHRTGMDTAAGGSRHAALDKGCETCHAVHKTGDPAQREFAFHLTRNAPALCLDCHDAKDAAMVKAHPDLSLAQADCLKCHDPHQSKSPKLLLASVTASAAPVVAQVTPEHPYIDPKDIKAESCLKCHPNVKAGKFVHTAVGMGCDNCHTATSEKNKTTMTYVAVGGDLCAMCHEAQKASVQHQPYKSGQCLVCHDPHTGSYANQLRASTNALCLECHGPDSDPQKLPGEHQVAIFDGKVKLPEDYFRQVPILPLKYGLGHPTEKHPVADAVNPKTKVAFQLNCLTCHQHHAGNVPAMLVKDQKNDMNFCKTCHANAMDLTDVRMGGK